MPRADGMMTDDELRAWQLEIADAPENSMETLCENRVMLMEPEHYMPELDRCQVVLGTRPVAQSSLPKPWSPGPWGTNVRCVVRCTRHRIVRPNAFLKDVPFERFKGFYLGAVGSNPGDAVAFRFELLRDQS